MAAHAAVGKYLQEQVILTSKCGAAAEAATEDAVVCKDVQEVLVVICKNQ
jgi:hypothetical protein